MHTFVNGGGLDTPLISQMLFGVRTCDTDRPTIQNDRPNCFNVHVRSKTDVYCLAYGTVRTCMAKTEN